MGNGKRDGGGGGGDRGDRGGGGGGGGDRRKKARFQRHGPGPSGGGHAIPQGARGLLVTCDAGRERRCGDEVSALCEAAFERLGTSVAAPAPAGVGAGEGSAGGASGGGETIDARLAAEVATLRDKRKDRFRYFETGVRGAFFLAFPSAFREPGAPGPVAVATDLVERARREGRSGSRFAQRLIPVERTCFGGLDELAAMALEVAKEYFGAVLEEGEEEEEEGKKKEEGQEGKGEDEEGSAEPTASAAAAAAAAAAEKKEGGEGEGEAKAEPAANEDEAKEEEKANDKAEEEGGGAKKEEGEEDKGKKAAAGSSPPPMPKRPKTSAAPGTPPLTFAVDVDTRACGRITRAAAIDVTAAPVPVPPHKVDLTNPGVTIVVQCVRNAATAAVVPRFRELMRLNLARAAQAGADEIDAREAAAAAGGGAGGKGEEGGGKEPAAAAAGAGAAAGATAE